MSEFVHLHVHTMYSPLESTIRIPDLIDRCTQQSMTAVAMTDHGNMCGAIDFYNKANSAGVKPIIGCDVFVEMEDEQSKFSARLVLLAMNKNGYLNLTKLVSRAYTENLKDKPVVKREWLEEGSEDIIALCGGLRSEVAWNLLQKNDENAAEKYLLNLKKIFGDRLYVELVASRLQELKTINNWLAEQSKKHSIEPVACSNVHYLDQEDAPAQEVISLIKLGRVIQDTRRKVSCDDFWFRDKESIMAEFAHLPEAITNTKKVADRCSLELTFCDEQGRTIYYLPKFEIPQHEKVTAVEDYLVLEGKRGLEKRFAHPTFKETLEREDWKELEKQYWKRFEFETDLIKRMDFSGYFLIVADFVQWAKNNNIPVGPGRGSGVGSIVAWALQITDIDPIRYDLLFERFINPERISMPDFDIDFCQERRGEVIEYVKEKYGRDRVSQIITFGKLQTKNCIRDVGRVLAMPYGEVDAIAKLVPDQLGIKLKEALEMEPKFQELRDANPTVELLFQHALKVEGLLRNFGKHAGGVIITDKPITQYSPLYADDDGNVMTQFDKDASETVGLVKFDFLGLKTLTQIQHAVNFVNNDERVENFSIESVTPESQDALELIASGNTMGVFQVESSGMTDLCKRIAPQTLNELTAINGLFRPGPLESGMVDDFIDRKHGRKEIEYPADQLEEVLKETFGVIVYQEQVMRSARVLAGYSLGEADILRRAMGKKKVQEMAAQKEKFIQGAKKVSNIEANRASAIFDLIEKFAGYGFNKSHSMAYSFITVRTAYLKRHFPAHFYAALLTIEMNDTDRLSRYITDAKEHNIPVLGPDVNQSVKSFNVVFEEDTYKIRFGLEAIKNVGSAAVDVILEERKENGSYRSLAEFCSRVQLRKVNKKAIEALVKSGAFDQLYEDKDVNRASIFAAIEVMMSWGAKEQEVKAIGQGVLFGASFADSDGPGLFEAEPQMPKQKNWDYLQKLEMERELLGFYVSGHPLDPYNSLLRNYASYTIEKVNELASEGKFVPEKSEGGWSRGRKNVKEHRLGGLITSFREIMTKKGSKMAFATLEDLTSKIEIVCFPKPYEECGKELFVGNPVIITGEIKAEESIAKLFPSKVSPLNRFTGEKTKDIKLVLFRLVAEDTNSKQLEKLRDICNRHKGDCRGVIEFSIAGGMRAKMQMGESLSFSPNVEFINEVREVFGRDVLAFH